MDNIMTSFLIYIVTTFFLVCAGMFYHLSGKIDMHNRYMHDRFLKQQEQINNIFIKLNTSKAENRIIKDHFLNKDEKED